MTLHRPVCECIGSLMDKLMRVEWEWTRRRKMTINLERIATKCQLPVSVVIRSAYCPILPTIMGSMGVVKVQAVGSGTSLTVTG